VAVRAEGRRVSASGRSDVADHEDARPFRRTGPDRFRIHSRRPYDPRSGALGDELEQELDPPVLVAGREDLVAATERERPENGVQRRRRVEDEREVVRGRSDVLAKRGRTPASSFSSKRSNRSTGSRSNSRCHS